MSQQSESKDNNYDRHDRDRLGENNEQDKEDDKRKSEQWEREAKELLRKRNKADE